MDKAEELKQEIRNHWTGFRNQLDELLEQYAQQVSRERDEWVAIEFATTYFTLGTPREQVHEYFDEWYNEWIKNQQ